MSDSLSANPLSIEDTLKNAIVELHNSGSESAALDAAVLLCHALDKPRSYLLTWPEKILDQDVYQLFSQLMERRVKGEPVAYIVGEREFWSLPLKVSPSTLIPRPDTERLVELALEKADAEPINILDLGTGTGAIALALASELASGKVTGIDLRPEAVELAKENSERLGLTNSRFLQGSWFEPVEMSENSELFSLIVSNPPYIEKDDPHLKQGDVRFEPLSALVSEQKGLADIRHIAENARNHLQSSGWLLFEHGYKQGEEVRQLMEDFGYTSVSTEKDYAGNDRVTMGQFVATE